MENTITQKHIDSIIEKSDIKAITIGDKTTVVYLITPTGFVIVESSSCVDPRNYDENMGYDICMDKIKDKLWELEGYMLQSHSAC